MKDIESIHSLAMSQLCYRSKMRSSILLWSIWMIASGCGHKEAPDTVPGQTAQQTSPVPIELPGLGELRASSCPPGSTLKEPDANGAVVSVNGRVAAACMKADGTNHGMSIVWHANKAKANRGAYRHGEREGEWTYWHENGEISGQGVFKKGKPDGMWTTWHDNQQKESEGAYVEGQHHGLFTRWDREGVVVKVLEYVNGLLARTVAYRDGKPISKLPEAITQTPTTARALNQQAADRSLGRAERCSAVFQVFSSFLSPGITGVRARNVLNDYVKISGSTTPANGPLGLVGDLEWLVDSVDEPVTKLAGWIPVDLNFDDSTFVIRCLATPRADLNGAKWSDWVIYGRLKGKNATTFGSFLSGRHDSVQLIEYALSTPWGKLEIYGPDGHKTIN